MSWPTLAGLSVTYLMVKHVLIIKSLSNNRAILGPNDKIQAVIDSGVCRRIVELLMNNQQSVVSAALRAVGNIVTGDDIQTQVIINCGALPCLLQLLSAPKESIRKEVRFDGFIKRV